MSFWGNHACPHVEAEADPVAFYSDGTFTFKAHHVGWIISGFFALCSTVVSTWLILQHLAYFTNRPQQRQIVRILLMVPIYAVCSFLSYVFYHEALYFHVIRDCYEAFIIASFFYLLIAYLGEDVQTQRAVFRRVQLDKWMWPLGSVKARPATGLYFLQMMKWGILQYVVIRPLTTIASCVLEHFDLYCDVSYAPWFGYLWDLVIVSISVTVAMYCLLQLAFVVLDDLQPYRPIMKFLCVKSVVFLMFWQSSCLGLVFSFGWAHPTQYFSAVDLQTGILALIETFEMMIFAFLHVKAFTYRVYRPDDRSLKTSRWKSFLHVLNHQDLLHEISAGGSYLWAKSRGREPDATRDDDLEALTGARRDEGKAATSEKAPEDDAVGLYQTGGGGDDGTDDLQQPWRTQIYSQRSSPLVRPPPAQDDRFSPPPASATRSRLDQRRAAYVRAAEGAAPATYATDARAPSRASAHLPADLPRLGDSPRHSPSTRDVFPPSPHLARPLSDVRPSFHGSFSTSDRGTFGHRHSVDGSRSPSRDRDRPHLRHQSTDSFRTAPTSPSPHPPFAVQTVWRQSATPSLEPPYSPHEGITPFVGIPQGAHLPSAGGVVRPAPRHWTATSFSPSLQDDMLSRDSRFPRFTPSTPAPPDPPLPVRPAQRQHDSRATGAFPRNPPGPLWHVQHEYDPRFPHEQRRDARYR